MRHSDLTYQEMRGRAEEGWQITLVRWLGAVAATIRVADP